MDHRPAGGRDRTQTVRDPTHAVQALERLERPRLVVERIRADDGDPGEVRELLDSGQIIDLEPDDRRKALGYLIGLGEHEDFPRIEHWLPIIAKGDPALLVDSLIDTAKRLLWAPSSRRVRPYLVWAERLGCTDRFLAGVILSPDRREDLEGGLYGVAEMLYEEVIATGQTSEYGQSLVALSQNPAAVCELIARLAEGRAPHLARRAGLADARQARVDAPFTWCWPALREPRAEATSRYWPGTAATASVHYWARRATDGDCTWSCSRSSNG